MKLFGLNSLDIIERFEKVSNNKIIYEIINYAFSLFSNPCSYKKSARLIPSI